MDDMQKLEHLLHHWIEHNNEHADTYQEWSKKVSALGNRQLADILGKIYQETKKVSGLLEEAIQSIKG